MDFIFPRISPYINLKTYNRDNLSDEVKNILSTSTSSGLILEDASNKDVSLLYDYIKGNTTYNINFYRNNSPISSCIFYCALNIFYLKITKSTF